MMWSKLKSRIEAGFADCLKGRVEVWNTRYRGAHDQEGEGWITIDGKRIHSMSSLSFIIARNDLFLKFRSDGDLSVQEAWDKAETLLETTGQMSLGGFNAALFDYLNLSIEDAIGSERTPIRAFAMLDRRLGRRRLQSYDLRNEPELVSVFHQIRCAFEGINLDRQRREEWRLACRFVRIAVTHRSVSNAEAKSEPLPLRDGLTAVRRANRPQL